MALVLNDRVKETTTTTGTGTFTLAGAVTGFETFGTGFNWSGDTLQTNASSFSKSGYLIGGGLNLSNASAIRANETFIFLKSYSDI